MSCLCHGENFWHISYLSPRLNTTYRCKSQWGDLILNLPPSPPSSSFGLQVCVPLRNPISVWKPHPCAPAFPRRDLGLEIGSRGSAWMGAGGFWRFKGVSVIQRKKKGEELWSERNISTASVLKDTTQLQLGVFWCANVSLFIPRH